MLKTCGIVCYRDTDGNFNGRTSKIIKDVKTDRSGLTKAERDAAATAVKCTLAAAYERYQNRTKNNRSNAQ